MSDDDFLHAMSDVQALKQIKRIVETTKKSHIIKTKSVHRTPATSDVEIHRFEAPFEFQEAGISGSKMQRIASDGKVEATLDLHGLYVQPSLDACVLFIKDSLACQRRLVCIIHGRGLHSPDGRAILKQAVFSWLKDGPYSSSILVVKSVQRGGASLVYLRRQRHG